jgi:hypothetical protein
MRRAKILQIRLTEREAEELDVLRGERTASDYVRSVVFVQGIAPGAAAELIQVDHTERAPTRIDGLTTHSDPVEPAAKRRGKLCPHGMRANVDNCWRCGGRARGEG